MLSDTMGKTTVEWIEEQNLPKDQEFTDCIRKKLEAFTLDDDVDADLLKLAKEFAELFGVKPLYRLKLQIVHTFRKRLRSLEVLALL